MALRIIEQAGATDVGRQRHHNEDALVLSPPFFAVADGMGGAKAGEVASHMATEVFAEPAEDDEGSEAQLKGMLHEANRRIHALASSDESRRGMGTTLTAAKLHGDELSIGHVGDSRAYRMRGETLEQLTRDHSLVAELERTGQISAEAAEHHPQRSIITRALGPEPDVQVDTYSFAGRDGDVFLLCSDGLTSMVSDEEVVSILRSSDGLQAAANTLVQAANQSGGKDNITVVLFRLGGEGGDDAGTATSDTIAGTIDAGELRRQAELRKGDAVLEPERARRPAATAVPPRAVPRRRRLRAGTVVRGLVALVLVAGVLTGLYALSRQVYFIGTDEAGLVTIYRGLPYELPFGIDLYGDDYTSSVPARAIPARRRDQVLDHEWRGREDARDLVRQLERGTLDAGFAGE